MQQARQKNAAIELVERTTWRCVDTLTDRWENVLYVNGFFFVLWFRFGGEKNKKWKKKKGFSPPAPRGGKKKKNKKKEEQANLEEVGKVFGVTRELYVRQSRSQAFTKYGAIQGPGGSTNS